VPYGIGQAIIFLPCGFFFYLLFSSPNLSSRKVDIYRTILLHMVWKNMLSSNTSSTCPRNMVNFGPLTAEIGSGVWGPLQISMGFAISCPGSVTDTARHSSSGHQPNFAALNRGRHLHSTEWPSHWALAHILVDS